MSKQPLIPPFGKSVDLSDYDPRYVDGMNKEEALEKTQKLKDRMRVLQEMLYAEGKHSLLIVLQAMDAGGKDGTIKHVFEGMNPQGIRVHSFKSPSEEELAHDYLWRIHDHTPSRGYIAIFNRSQYEDVLIVRVRNLVKKEAWKKRYDQINDFEEMLHENGTDILKFYLHIDKDEQKERFQERLDRPDKNWKFSHADLEVRTRWDDYMKAYEDVLSKCNTEYAPWHIIPANRKWYRNYVVCKTIVEKMEDMKLEYPAPEENLDKVVIPD